MLPTGIKSERTWVHFISVSGLSPESLIWSIKVWADAASAFFHLPQIQFQCRWELLLLFLTSSQLLPARVLTASYMLVIILTIHRCPFGKNCDGPLGHPLLANHRGDLGPPAVWTHPQEVTRLVVPFSCIQNSSVLEKEKIIQISEDRLQQTSRAVGYWFRLNPT